MNPNKLCILVLTLLKIAVGEDCDNVCYKDVKKGLSELNEICENPPVVSDIPPLFDNIVALIKKIENIIPSLPELQDSKNISLSLSSIIQNEAKKLALLQNIVTEINTINKYLQILQRKKDIHNEAFTKCNNANALYETLKKDVDSIRQIANNINVTFDSILKQIDIINEQSLNIKADLDEISIPDTIFQSYLCNSRLEATIEEVIQIMKNLANEMKSSFSGIVDLKLEELENYISDSERDIDIIEDNLSEDMPTTDIKVTKETIPLLDDLKEQVSDLKRKVTEIKLDKTFEDILRQADKKLQELLKEYEIILQHIFSIDTLKKVTKEIENAKEVLNLLKERDVLKAELEDLRKIVETLKNNGICFINETVSVEE